MSNTPNDQAEDHITLDNSDGDEFSPKEDIISTIARWITQCLVIGLVFMMCAEMFVRSMFYWSIQFSNELGGYALVAIAFLSLGSGQLTHAYHRVHFVENRLGPLGRARLKLFFNIIATLVMLILSAEFIRFEWITWNSGDVAATSLMTPLWIPRLAMPLGTLVLTWALISTLAADIQRIKAITKQQT